MQIRPQRLYRTEPGSTGCAVVPGQYRGHYRDGTRGHQELPGDTVVGAVVGAVVPRRHVAVVPWRARAVVPDPVVASTGATSAEGGSTGSGDPVVPPEAV